MLMIKLFYKFQHQVFAILAFVVLFFFQSAVLAHPLDVVYADIKSIDHTNYQICLNIHPTPFKIITEMKSLFTVTSNIQACQQTLQSSLATDTDVKICYLITCPKPADEHLPFDRKIVFDFLQTLDPLFTIIGKFSSSDGESIFTANQQNNFYFFKGNQQNFFHLGVEHIGATPQAWFDEQKKFRIADGIDHVLFVLVLMLVSLGWKALLLNVTGFTIGHSLSLGLSLANIVTFPALYIEPAIAASIMLVAIMAFFKNSYKKSFGVTLVFGFLHGMGFSYILEGLKSDSVTELLKTLLLFNLGIETGQLIILMVFAPLFWFIMTSKTHGQKIKKTLSFIIFMLAAYWTVERTLNIFA